MKHVTSLADDIASHLGPKWSQRFRRGKVRALLTARDTEFAKYPAFMRITWPVGGDVAARGLEEGATIRASIIIKGIFVSNDIVVVPVSAGKHISYA